MNGREGSTDRERSSSPLCRSNGDRSCDSPPQNPCDDGSDNVVTPTPGSNNNIPLHQQIAPICMQDSQLQHEQQQQPTATIHGVQVHDRP